MDQSMNNTFDHRYNETPKVQGFNSPYDHRSPYSKQSKSPVSKTLDNEFDRF